MEKRYVVDEHGERVSVILPVEEYERLLAAQDHAGRTGRADPSLARETARGDTADSDAPPDDEDFDPEEGERRITEFIASADELPGPPVADLAERVADLMRASWKDIESLVEGQPHNKVLATQLLLSQRARGLQPDDDEQWRLSAASTLLSGMVIASASADEDE